MLPYTDKSKDYSDDAFDDLGSLSSRSSDCATDRKDSNNKSTDNLNEAEKELVFKLCWSTRDAINACLNQYTQLLYGDKAETAMAKDKLKKDNAILYELLLDLPLKSDTGVSAGGERLNRITLDLDSDSRSQIVNVLLANHTLLVHTETTSEKCKMKMVEQNNDLICKLAKLQISKTPVIADNPALNENVIQLAKNSFGRPCILMRTQATEKADVLSKLIKLTELADSKLDYDPYRKQANFDFGSKRVPRVGSELF